MNGMNILSWIQVVLAVLLIAAILFGRTGSDGIEGGAFGGSSEMKTFSTRRGGEKILFIATIVIAILFTIASILMIIL